MGYNAGSRLILDGYNGGDGGIILPTEAIAYWKFNEPTGDVLDYKNAYTLTQNGTVPSDAGILDGARGAYSAANYFTVSSTSGSSATEFDGYYIGVDCWIKTPQAGIQYICGKSGVNTGWSLIVENGSTILTYNGIEYINGSTTVNNNQWYHIFMANRASGTNERRIYVNGVLEAQGPGVSWTKTTDAFKVGLGQIGAQAYPFGGLIDDMAIFNLTSTTKTWTDWENIITRRYNNGKGRVYTNDP